MAWRYTARKGFIKKTGGSSREDIIRRQADRLRKEGYKVKVYKVK